MTSGGGEVAAAISARQLETPDAKLPKLLKRIRAGLSGLYVHAEIPIARLVIVVVVVDFYSVGVVIIVERYTKHDSYSISRVDASGFSCCCTAHTELTSGPPHICVLFPSHGALHSALGAEPWLPNVIPQKQACPAWSPKYLKATPVAMQSWLHRSTESAGNFCTWSLQALSDAGGATEAAATAPLLLTHGGVPHGVQCPDPPGGLQGRSHRPFSLSWKHPL